MNALVTLAIVVGSVAYGLAGLVCARLVAGHFAYKFRDADMRRYPSLYRNGGRYPSLYRNGGEGPPGGEQWTGAAGIGLCLGVVWPLFLVWRNVSLDRFAIGAEAADRRRQQQTRIEELERELQIGQRAA